METRDGTTASTEIDAAEFGLHVRQGGWRLGMLVARNVSPGEGGRGNRRGYDSSKVSARQFAEHAGTSADRVLRYLKAWENAAGDDVVPPAADLVPGQDVDLDVSELPSWGQYYPTRRYAKANPTEEKLLTRAANRAEKSYGEMANILLKRPDLSETATALYSALSEAQEESQAELPPWEQAVAYTVDHDSAPEPTCRVAGIIYLSTQLKGYVQAFRTDPELFLGRSPQFIYTEKAQRASVNARAAVRKLCAEMVEMLDACENKELS